MQRQRNSPNQRSNASQFSNRGAPRSGSRNESHEWLSREPRDMQDQPYYPRQMHGEFHPEFNDQGRNQPGSQRDLDQYYDRSQQNPRGVAMIPQQQQYDNTSRNDGRWNARGGDGRRAAYEPAQPYDDRGVPRYDAGQSGHDDSSGSHSGYGQQSWRQDQQSGHRQSGQGDSERQSFYGKGPKGYTRSDDRIKEDICERLTNCDVDCSEVEIQVAGGNVTLSGTTTDKNSRRMVEDIADECMGVKDVDNRVRINRGGAASMSGGSKETMSSNASTSMSARSSEHKGTDDDTNGGSHGQSKRAPS